MMEAENYINMVEKYLRVVSERNKLSDGIKNLKEIIAEDDRQEIDNSIVINWTRYKRSEYEQYGNTKIHANAKNLLKYYESELVFINNKLNMMRDRINREKLSSW